MIVTAYVSIGLVGCKRESRIEIPDDELEGLDETQRESVIEGYIREWKDETVEWWWWE